MPELRAFVFARWAVVATAMLGGGCVGAPPAPPAEVKLEPSGDVELDWLRRLAVQAPIDELFEHDVRFLALRIGPYSKDEILWKGVERMTLEILNNPARPADRSLLGFLIGSIEGPAHPDTPSLKEHLPELKRRRDLFPKPQAPTGPVRIRF